MVVFIAGAFVQQKTERLDDVLYFSAFAYWLPDSRNRHQGLVEANRQMSVTPVMGNFKQKRKICPKCRQQYTTHEEKQSDVNIAISLLHYAYHGNFEKAFIVSADSDLCPAINLVKKIFPQKKIIIIIPPGRGGITRELRQCADAHYKIRPKHLKSSLLPGRIILSDGTELHRPEKYNPPC